MRRLLLLVCLFLVPAITGIRPAHAQFGGMGGAGRMPGGGGPGGAGMGPTEEKEAAAEAAPEIDAARKAAEPPAEWPGQQEKKLKIFEIDGYLRSRAYFFHDLSLGVPPTTDSNAPRSSFPIPYSEYASASNCATREGKPCTNQDLGGADLRLRIEPTFQPADWVRVHAQVDLLDNLVLGSSPDPNRTTALGGSTAGASAFFTRGQGGDLAALGSAIRVKRAWGEIHTPIGDVSFGRMPAQWGMGILFNDGSCADCDYGTSVDRVMFQTKFWNHFLALMWDFAATGPTTRLYNAGINGPAWSADGIDDVEQWGIAIGRRDSAESIRERLARGEFVVNYGAHVLYRRQSWDQSAITTQSATTSTADAQAAALAANLTPRDAWAIIPDLWLRLAYRSVYLEAEASAVGGRVNQNADLLQAAKSSGGGNGNNILQFGGVIRAGGRLLRDALHIGMEIGYASGDSTEDPYARLHAAVAQHDYRDGRTIGRFQFDPDYHVDLILFRRILGAVSNAVYFKPTASYDILKNLTVRADAIYSIAANAVGYPGNSTNLGLELDASLTWRDLEHGLDLSLAYGVLFPFAGLSLPETIYPGHGHDAETAQAVQLRALIRF